MKTVLKISSLVFLILSTLGLKAQEAEKLYKEQYSRFSFIYQPSIHRTPEAKYPSTPNLLLVINDYSAQYGVWFNAYQISNWSFRTGLMLSNYTVATKFNINENELNGATYLTNEKVHSCSHLITVPLKADFLLPV